MPELETAEERAQRTQQREQTMESYLASTAFREHLHRALPKHLNSERFYTGALRQINAIPDLRKCTIASVAGGIMQAGILGLEIATLGECWLIPYQDRKNDRHVAQLQVGYLGLLSLAWRSGQVAGVQIDYVDDVDDFDYRKGTDGYIVHKPGSGRSYSQQSLTHVYAIVKTTLGGLVWDVFDRDRIERIRAHAQSPNSPAWTSWYPEMAMAKCLKSVLKFAPKTRDLARAIRLEDEGEAGIEQSFNFDIDLPALPAQASRQAGQEVVDAAAEAQAMGAPQPPEPEPAAAPPPASNGPQRGPRPPSSPRGGLGW